YTRATAMHVEIDPIVGTAGTLADGVQRGNLILEKMLGDFKDQTTARWAVEKDASSPSQLTLELTSGEGVARASFSEQEIANGQEFWWQLNELWDATLRDGILKGLKRIDQALQEEAVADHAS